MSEYIYRSNGEPLTNERGEISLALAGEIVRCRDCRFYEDTGDCTWFECSSCWLLAEVNHDGFCAWGERHND